MGLGAVVEHGGHIAPVYPIGSIVFAEKDPEQLDHTIDRKDFIGLHGYSSTAENEGLFTFERDARCFEICSQVGAVG